MTKRAPGLTKAEHHTLAAHLSWQEWGDRFGFRLYGTNDEWLGHFKLGDGSDFVVPKFARDAIDAALNGEQEQSR